MGDAKLLVGVPSASHADRACLIIRAGRVNGAAAFIGRIAD
jgi:hypothetical protein